MKTSKFIFILLSFQFLLSISFTQYYEDYELVPDKQNGKYGYMLYQNNQIILAHQFDEADHFYSGLARVCRDGKYGFIDKWGNLMIGFEYEDAGSFYSDFCNVKKNGLWGYIDQYNNLVIDFKYGMAFPFREGFAAVKKNEKFGFINKMDEPVTDFIFDKVNCFMEGVTDVMIGDTVYVISYDNFEISRTYSEMNYFFLGSAVQGVYQNKMWSLYNQIEYDNLTPLIYDDLRHYSEGLIAVKMNNKWGFSDKAGDQVIDCQYDNAGSFASGVVNVKSNGKWGYIDKDNRQVISFQYDYASPFFKDLAWVVQDKMVFPIDRSGSRQPTGHLSKIINFSEGLGVVNIENKFGFINTTGKIVIPPMFDFAADFHSGRSRIRSGSTFGYIDKSGKLIIGNEFYRAQDFHQGAAIVWGGHKFGYEIIDTMGRILNDYQFIEIRPFHEGLAAASNVRSPEILNEFELYPYQPEWGYINTNGYLQISFQFEWAGDFEQGYAPVRREDGYYFINDTGEPVSQKFFHMDFQRNYIIGASLDENLNDMFYAVVGHDGTIRSDWFHDISLFENGIAIVAKDDRMLNYKALMDTSFTIISEFYNGISEYDRNLFLVTKMDSNYNSSLAFYDKAARTARDWFDEIENAVEGGNVIVSKYDEEYGQLYTIADASTGILGQEWYHNIGWFTNGIAVAERYQADTDQQEYTCINLKGNRICGFYDYMGYLDEGFLFVEHNDQTGLVTSSGLYPVWFSEFFEVSEGIAVAYGKKRYWYIDNSGRLLTNDKHIKEARLFHEDLAAVMDKNNLYGFINTEGELIIPFKYNEVWDYSENLAGVWNTEDDFGYIDKKGQTVVPFIYSSGKSFKDGRALVRKGGEEFYINKAGERLE